MQLESLQQQTAAPADSAENVTVSATLPEVTTATTGGGEAASQDLLATDNQQVLGMGLNYP